MEPVERARLLLTLAGVTLPEGEYERVAAIISRQRPPVAPRLHSEPVTVYCPRPWSAQ